MNRKLRIVLSESMGEKGGPCYRDRGVLSVSHSGPRGYGPGFLLRSSVIYQNVL